MGLHIVETLLHASGSSLPDLKNRPLYYYNSQDTEATSVSINRVTNQDDVVHIHTMEYHPAIKRRKTVPFAATWMALESVILCEASHTQKDRYHVIPLICGI